jgi:chromosome segregation ATPase
MPRDKAKKFDSDPKNFSSIIPIEEDKTLNTGKGNNNVLPLGSSRYGFNVLEQNDGREGRGDASPTMDAPVEQGVEAMSEIKSRVEAVLSRIKAETSEMGLNEGPDYKTAELVKPPDARLEAARVDYVPEHQGTVTGSLSTGSLGTGPLLKSLTIELERRRSELFAQVRIAEARAQEIEERFRDTERRLEQELSMRRTAEQRLRELEDEYLHRLTAAEEEELKRLDAEAARERAEANLIEYEKRVKEAEGLMRAETEARTHSEKAMKEAEGRAEAASLALAEAERRKAEAEGKAQSAEENARAIEGLIDEAESIANAARDRYKNAEVRMQQEIQLRNEAEARLKDLENELGTLLASDNWNKIEPRSDVDLSDEAALHLKSQVESEQKVRAAAEEARTAAEVRVRQLEEELFKYEEKYRQVEEKHRQAEAGFKKILRKQEAELRSLSEQVTRANSTTTDLTVIKSSGKNDAQTAIASMNKNAQLKLVSYGFVIGVLSIGVLFLIYQLYVQYFS